MTSVPDFSASWASIRALPVRSRRARRSSRIALRAPDPPLVAGPAGLDPLADPDLLLGQPLVEEGVLALLGGERGLLAFEEGRVVARPVEEPAAVDLDDPGGQPAEERPVVGDEDQRPAEPEQVVFEPADRLDVEVVRRLVQQQDVGLADQRPGPAGPGASSPRRATRTGRRGRASSARGRGRPRGPGVWPPSALVEPGGDLVEDRAAPPLGDLLGQPGDPDPLRADDLALVGRRGRRGGASAGSTSPPRSGRPARPARRARPASRPCPAASGPPNARLTPRMLTSAMDPSPLGPIGPLDPGGPTSATPAPDRSSLAIRAPARQSRGWHRALLGGIRRDPRGGTHRCRTDRVLPGRAPDNRGRTLPTSGPTPTRRWRTSTTSSSGCSRSASPAGTTPDAPLLDDADVAEFRADPALCEALRRSLRPVPRLPRPGASRAARSSKGPTSPARATSGGTPTTTGCGSPGSWPARGCSAWRPRAGRSSPSWIASGPRGRASTPPPSATGSRPPARADPRSGPGGHQGLVDQFGRPGAPPPCRIDSRRRSAACR